MEDGEGLGISAGTGCDVAATVFKPLFWRANLIGAIFIPSFLDFREERLRAVIGFEITMATTEQSAL